MTTRVNLVNLQINQTLFNFIENDVLPGTEISSASFWSSFSDLIYDLTPTNQALLEKREFLQQKIDAWHRTNNVKTDFASYKHFLTDIGYITPPVENFTIETENVDDEIATLAGPQLVVPVMNARFALNAVNARWGSLYDALYGSNVISEENGAEKTQQYNPIRGNSVIAYARDFLDQAIPLNQGSHHDVVKYKLTTNGLSVELSNGKSTHLTTENGCLGFSGEINSPRAILFTHNGLHFELQFDENSRIGKSDKANVSDILVESALTTIMDCEDSVAAVDGEDKVIAYKNWLGLIKGSLTETINKNGKTFTRAMADDRQYHSFSAKDDITLSGRSLMFVRNVGHLMTNNAILDSDGNEVPEGIMDAMITSLIAKHDIVNQTNSKKGSIYIVKPKMHGPEEVAFANTLFSRVEKSLSLPANTIKMGIMDEERRTSVNLKACIYAAKSRVAFINTGFLDRTGDEIHTSMHAGAIARKGDIKNTVWIDAYERNNVDIGLACGLNGHAQIGKGMWAIPDDMASMMKTKIAHAKSGANTAWVPSPTAATLHALHYHQVKVTDIQTALKTRESANVDDILTIPLAANTNWTLQEITDELDNNAQGILGYVVRWIDQGIGCSKVPDINHVGLMEDRATLRISSQHITNWLMHNICTEEQVIASLTKMAKVVDGQNKHDPLYQPMSNNLKENIAFNAAKDLIFKGDSQPSGYTEPLLHQYRRLKKAADK